MTNPKKLPDQISDLPKLLQVLLANRGLTSINQVRKFLAPDYDDLADPFLMHDMQTAIDRILSAMAENQTIAIYADYDADGVPGAAVLADFFTQIGYANFSVYIPHRHDEGYGFHIAAIEQLAADGTKLIITIDLGTSAEAAVDRASELGVDVVITDHHEPAHGLPKAVAIVNPKLGDYPDRMLCGAAVIFQLVRAMIFTLRDSEKKLPKSLLEISEKVSAWPEGYEKWWLDLVGLSTIADMVPLVGENRILARYGLLVGRKTRRPGLIALSRHARFNLRTLDETDIGFTIAPRINSASRMEHAFESFKLLSTSDPAIALEQAKKLSSLNDKRKRVTATTVKQAKKMLSERTVEEVLVIGHPDWNPGILSILSGKLSEQYNRSTFVWTIHGSEKIKGSVRAAEGESVLDLMHPLADQFIKFGGHQAAGGFTCVRENIHTLEGKLRAVHADLYGKKVKSKAVAYQVDGELLFSECSPATHKMIRQLAPFGMGNPEPVFIFSDGILHGLRQFGKHEEHIEVTIKDSKGRFLKAVAFYKTANNYSYTPQIGEGIRVVGNVTLNRFLGKEELRLSLIDILPE